MKRKRMRLPNGFGQISEIKGRRLRKPFITRAKKKGLDEFAIKRLVGHAISDITERVYTERDVEWLRTEVNKL